MSHLAGKVEEEVRCFANSHVGFGIQTHLGVGVNIESVMLPAGCGWCVQTVAKIDRSWGTYLGPEARRRVSFTKA